MRFAYQAIDRSGQRVSDVVEAAAENEAAERVRSRGLFLLRMETESDEAASAESTDGDTIRFSAFGHTRNLVMFTQQMAMLLGAGAGVVPALATVERQCKNTWRALIGAIRGDVESGLTLAESMNRFPRHFDGVIRSMVAAGESAGTLPEMFSRLARMTRQQATVRNHVIGASIYPALLLFVAIGVIGTMLGFVLPRFTTLFTTLQVDLPTSTARLIALGDWLRDNWMLLLISIVAGVTLLVGWLRTPKGRVARDELLVSLPAVGTVVRRVTATRIIRIWGHLLESKIPMLEALRLSRDSTSNTVFRQLFDEVESSVTEGQSIVPILENSPLLTPAIVAGIHTGEQSGQMPGALLFLAEHMEVENDQLIASLVRITEPAILLCMGVVVGSIAISLFLPLFDIASAAGGGG